MVLTLPLTIFWLVGILIEKANPSHCSAMDFDDRFCVFKYSNNAKDADSKQSEIAFEDAKITKFKSVLKNKRLEKKIQMPLIPS